jgi:hypothetical protein
MKPIAVQFMELLPICSKARRSFPVDAAACVSDGDYVCLWDLASFTSTLSELRHFLYWCARLLESDARVRQHPVRVFDYNAGIVELNLWDMLDAYNEEVNCYCGFSIHRILDCMDLEAPIDPEMRLVNSGGLGVVANIGFSTSFGGVHTALGVKDKNSGAAIGDDVLGITEDDPRCNGLIEHVQAIGNIARDKFAVFQTDDRFDDTSGWKFVKRPFRMTSEGFDIGDQVNIPILAFVFGAKSENRKFPMDTSKTAVIHKFASQVSALLWDLQKSNLFVSDDDIDILHHYLLPAYKALGLPFRGCLPGYKIMTEPPVTMMLALPSILFQLYDPRAYDWAEYLWDSAPQPFCILPLLSPTPIVLKDEELQVATSTRFNGVWVDLGYVEELKPLQQIVPVQAGNKRQFQNLLSHEGYPMIEYRRVKSLPRIYHESYDLLSRVSMQSGDVFDNSLGVYNTF